MGLKPNALTTSQWLLRWGVYLNLSTNWLSPLTSTLLPHDKAQIPVLQGCFYKVEEQLLLLLSPMSFIRFKPRVCGLKAKCSNHYATGCSPQIGYNNGLNSNIQTHHSFSSSLDFIAEDRLSMSSNSKLSIFSWSTVYCLERSAEIKSVTACLSTSLVSSVVQPTS